MFQIRYDMETEAKRKILQSFEDFEAWARQKATERPEQHREGQFIYNLLYMSFPEQVELLGYCGIDCFHNDSMIHPFLMELSKMNSLISLISNRVVEVFSDYGLKATILKVNISYQIYSFELKIEKRTSRRKINEVAYSLNERPLKWKKNIRVDFSGCNPILEVGVPPLPYQIHTRNIFHEPYFNSQLLESILSVLSMEKGKERTARLNEFEFKVQKGDYGYDGEEKTPWISTLLGKSTVLGNEYII